MAIGIYGTGSQVISTPDMWNLQEVAGPGVFSALIDLQHHNGIEVRLGWVVDDGGEPTMVWSSHVTVDTSTIDVAPALLSPPVPIVTAGRLRFEFYGGTPGSPATVPWVVYKL